MELGFTSNMRLWRVDLTTFSADPGVPLYIEELCTTGDVPLARAQHHIGRCGEWRDEGGGELEHNSLSLSLSLEVIVCVCVCVCISLSLCVCVCVCVFWSMVATRRQSLIRRYRSPPKHYQFPTLLHRSSVCVTVRILRCFEHIHPNQSMNFVSRFAQPERLVTYVSVPLIFTPYFHGVFRFFCFNSQFTLTSHYKSALASIFRFYLIPLQLHCNCTLLMLKTCIRDRARCVCVCVCS